MELDLICLTGIWGLQVDSLVASLIPLPFWYGDHIASAVASIIPSQVSGGGWGGVAYCFPVASLLPLAKPVWKGGCTLYVHILFFNSKPSPLLFFTKKGLQSVFLVASFYPFQTGKGACTAFQVISRIPLPDWYTGGKNCFLHWQSSIPF